MTRINVDIEKMRALFALGWGDREVAEELGVKRTLIAKRREEFGIKSANSSILSSIYEKTPAEMRVEVAEADERFAAALAGQTFKDHIRPSTGPLPKPWPKPRADSFSAVGSSMLHIGPA